MKSTTPLFCAFLLCIAAPAVWAQGSFPPALQNDLDGSPIGGDARKAIVFIHGWNPQADADKYNATDEWFYLKNIMRQKLTGTDWKLVLYHWEVDANTGLIGWGSMPFVQNAANAADWAVTHGEHLASLLNRDAPNLRQVQLIAHSAGSWAARQAALSLLQNNPYVTVQITLLDPFIPSTVPFPLIPVTSLTTDLMNNLAYTGAGDRLYRMENYYADDTVTYYPNLPTVGTDNVFDWRIGDINQRVDHGATGVPGLSLWYDSHAGPIEFYADTVSASIFGNSVPIGLNTLSPSFVTLGWYRSLSEEWFLLPRITAHPQSQSVNSGAAVTLSVTASDSRPLSYQWFKNGQSISGAGSSLPITATATAAGDYVVRVSNVNGPVFSEKATLTVNTPNAPAISSLSPTSLPTSSSPQLITIYGWNFKPAGDPNASLLIFTDPANTQQDIVAQAVREWLERNAQRG